ncbi:GumC family protein [Paraflavitalea pollutisoli]|uniref:GumC family protein n=1 Tax=Paraflavitalea pollutisoli TaxID=3034143 RepID=UPI0023EC81D8|nr:polysaccharide biosynthesis tyrosine autokinase [Paraflavitalea sp. H1-2-19X]
MSEETFEKKQSKLPISPREIVFKYIRYLPWILVSLLLMFTLAYIKLRYSPAVYNTSGKLLVATQSAVGGGGEKFDDIFMMQRADKINDEMEIIRSRYMAARVVRSLNLQTQVFNKGKIRSTIVHPRDMPFVFEILSIADSTQGAGVQVTLENDHYKINEDPQKRIYNEPVNAGGMKFRLTRNNSNLKMFSSNIFGVSWSPLEGVAAALTGGINVIRVNDNTSVLALSYKSENIKQGIDIVNQYMKEYQQGSLEDKKEIAAKTLEFIDEQLDTVFRELGGVERNLQRFRETNQIYDAEAQTKLFFDQLSESNKQVVEQELRLRAMDHLIKHLSDKANQYMMISFTMGIEEPALLQQVTGFNRLQLERQTALQTTPASNPRIIEMDAAIEQLRLDMLQTVRNLRQTLDLSLNQMNTRGRESDRLISQLPSKEKQLREVTRQQGILQELSAYLLQKKLETAIASASTISSIKVMEPAMASGIPVSPNRKLTYIIAFVIGLAIPTAIILVRDYMNDRVRSKQEIEQITDTPILGEVGHADQATALVVTSNSRKFLAEQFRIIRSNLQYILPKVEKPIILVTSSFSGEGKSFVSTNLGSVLALSGKKTAILEFDIRKPKIMKGLGLQERKGITNYIVSDIKLSDIVYPVPEVQNLFVVPCGPVPPNPSEMLLNERINELFAELLRMFDTVIIDTAPVGLVSDAITLGKHAHAAVYIVRHNYTFKKQIQLIDDIHRNEKLPHLSIIVNDINKSAGYGGYYGYGGYGYGYGYGYGNNNGNGGYFEGGDKKKRWFNRSKK